jgi:hypothetical protein
MSFKSQSSFLIALGNSINKIFLNYEDTTIDHQPEIFLCCVDSYTYNVIPVSVSFIKPSTATSINGIRTVSY